MTNSFGGYFIEELSVGQVFVFKKVLGKDDVQKFADASGDNNPVHLDDEFAAGTQFKKCIVHGMLTAGVISAAIGTQMPGPGSIYISQNLKFRRPVTVGSEVSVELEIKDININRKFVTIATNAIVDGKPVITGEAVVMVPSKA